MTFAGRPLEASRVDDLYFSFATLLHRLSLVISRLECERLSAQEGEDVATV